MGMQNEDWIKYINYKYSTVVLIIPEKTQFFRII